MSSFSYSNENQYLYLEYNIDGDEIVNEEELKKFTEKKREGIVKTQFCKDDKGNCIKYDVTSLITLRELLTQGVTDKVYCAILHSVATTFNLLEEEKISVSSLVLNEELIYYDNGTKAIKFISIPTTSFVNEITPGQIMYEFSKLIISRMEEVNNLILEVNDYLANREFNFVEFNCLINSIIMSTNEDKKSKMTKREYDEQLDGGNNLVSNSQLLSQVTIMQQGEGLQQELENSNLYKNIDDNNLYENLGNNNLYKELDNNNLYKNLNNNAVSNSITNDFAEGNIVANNDGFSSQAGSSNIESNNIASNRMALLKKNSKTINDNVKEITDNAKKIFKNKVGDIQKALGNLKNLKNNKGANNSNLEQIPVNNYDMNIGKETYQEAIRYEVARQKENDKQRMEDIKNNFENNRIFNYQAINNLDDANGNHTVILDCMSGEVSDGNAINTCNPYLVRESTGEKIYINSNNFKLGRGRKFVDYYVGGNDTISKIHAYITSNARDYFIVDNSSRNHTYLDGVKLEPVVQTVLKHMSKIRLAKEEFVFHLF